MGRAPSGTVKETGAPAGAVLEGAIPVNKGLRVKVHKAQRSGKGEIILGSFDLLAAAEGKYSDELKQYEGESFTSAKELLDEIRRNPEAEKCTHILNRNTLRILEGRPYAAAPRAIEPEPTAARSEVADIPNKMWIERLLERLKNEGRETASGGIEPAVLKEAVLKEYYEAQGKEPPAGWWEQILATATKDRNG